MVPVKEEALPTAAVTAPARPGFRDRLAKARSAFAQSLGPAFGRSDITTETWEQLEEALILSDVGMTTSSELLEYLRTRARSEGWTHPDQLLEALRENIVASLNSGSRELRFVPGSPNVWLFVGVNGVGKTTTIGKVAKQQADTGRTVILAAGDTFRAAAAEQLGMWAERVGVELVRGAEGADPGSVIFSAVERAAAKRSDLVLADTAGRLQSKVNLMNELDKIRRVAQREPGVLSEALLVLDATTGQNGLNQAKQFAEAAGLTGVVLTKLDGSAKGGIALTIQRELGLPIKLVGLGEGIEDLVEFDPEQYARALIARD